MEEEVRATVIEISRLDLAPDEVLIIRVPDRWNMDAAEKFAHGLAHSWERAGIKGKYLILPHVELHVMNARVAQAEEQPVTNREVAAKTTTDGGILERSSASDVLGTGNVPTQSEYASPGSDAVEALGSNPAAGSILILVGEEFIKEIGAVDEIAREARRQAIQLQRHALFGAPLE